MLGEPNPSGYDDYYRSANYFNYRNWLYRPYIRALASEARLSYGSRLLDAGCGQGFFSALFAEQGVNVVGVDTSIEGIDSARRQYSGANLRFEAGDVLSLPFGEEFDCVFTRSCSLYNVDLLQDCHKVTRTLLSYLRPGGILIFDYYSRVGRERQSESWIYHSIHEVRQHVSGYYCGRAYFSTRFDTMILGRLAFTRPATVVNSLIGRLTGLGGEMVAFLTKATGAATPNA
jgi:SAM-dependent methyltransferase